MARNLKIEKKVESHKISDSSQLLWGRFYGPMQAAAQQFNNAVVTTQNLLAEIILEKEGFSKETHQFNMDNLTILERPKPNDK